MYCTSFSYVLLRLIGKHDRIRTAPTYAAVRQTVRLSLPLLAGAFADRIARRRGQEGRYQLANGMGAMLDADDALSRHAWSIAPLLLQGCASPDARILLALPVDIDELVQRCPQLVQQSDTVEWDDAQGTLKAWRRLQIGLLTAKAQPGWRNPRKGRVASGDA